MVNLKHLYGQRFQAYFRELQKYMQFIFTGHIAVVMLFAIGALGYSYSEWLKQPHPDFPVYLISSLALTIAILPNKPALLLRHADQYYLLPMAESIRSYIEPALKYSAFVVTARSLVVFIVLLPMLSKIGQVQSFSYLFIAIIVAVSAWWNVYTKYFHSLSNRYSTVWDVLIRALILICLFYGLFSSTLWATMIGITLAIVYLYVVKRAERNPFPFDQMIALEQSRMQRFYQFANYFTEVPYVKSKVSRRSWLDGVMPNKPLHTYLLTRSLLRKDELFYTWGRLVLLMLFIPLLDFSLVASVLVTVFSFAITIQLYQGLLYNQIFRMDMLYPNPNESREGATIRLVRKVAYIPLSLASMLLLWQHGVLYGVGVLIVSIFISEWFYNRKKRSSRN